MARGGAAAAAPRAPARDVVARDVVARDVVARVGSAACVSRRRCSRAAFGPGARRRAGQVRGICMGDDMNPPRRILLVEDEGPLRRCLTLNLARRGYSVAEADSVESADDALHAASFPVDAITLDVNMP